MDTPIEQYWNLRLESLKQQLERNNFEVHVALTPAEVAMVVMDTIVPASGARTVSYGGSMTMKQTGVYDALITHPELEVLRPDEPGLSAGEKLERRRQALLVDLYMTGTNAVTEDGTLVNLDMIGNRVGALTFGPKTVVVLVGRNKIVPDLEAAMTRIKDYASPANAMRLDCKTPCVKTGFCADCNSEGRICNTWTVTEKSFPKARIKVVLINRDLGL